MKEPLKEPAEAAKNDARAPLTSSQTIGPFWHALVAPALADLTRLGAAGPRLELSGAVTDGAGAPVADACLELWQPHPAASPQFPGWGRCATDAAGRFRFVTLETSSLSVIVMARGLLKPLWTRVYFPSPGETGGLARPDAAAMAGLDPQLASLPAARRATLLATPEGGGRWRWDVRLQGEGETVFLDF